MYDYINDINNIDGSGQLTLFTATEDSVEDLGSRISPKATQTFEIINTKKMMREVLKGNDFSYLHILQTRFS